VILEKPINMHEVMVNMREFGGNPKFEYREIPSFGASFIFA